MSRDRFAVDALGTIAALTEEAEEESTPLEKRLERLGHRLIWVTLAIAGAVAIAGVVAGRAWGMMIETSIALAVAAIAEGLPVVATLALARGMLRMARRNAVVQRLAAVETLGATNVICTDKTGTLTRNELTVARVWLSNGLVEIDNDGKAVRDGHRLTEDDSRTLKDILTIVSSVTTRHFTTMAPLSAIHWKSRCCGPAPMPDFSVPHCWNTSRKCERRPSTPRRG